MCLAVPGRIKKIFKDGSALIDFLGVEKRAALDLVEDPGKGDYVIVHAGFAINKLNKKEARESIKLFKEMGKKSAVSDKL
jgi:hydrogenase expression/formation protein HypC